MSRAHTFDRLCMLALYGGGIRLAMSEANVRIISERGRAVLRYGRLAL